MYFKANSFGDFFLKTWQIFLHRSYYLPIIKWLRKLFIPFNFSCLCQMENFLELIGSRYLTYSEIQNTGKVSIGYIFEKLMPRMVLCYIYSIYKDLYMPMPTLCMISLWRHELVTSPPANGPTTPWSGRCNFLHVTTSSSRSTESVLRAGRRLKSESLDESNYDFSALVLFCIKS